MKAKKLLFPLLLVIVIVLSLSGCMRKTEYNNKQVTKIETQMYNGEAFVGYRMRLFDFVSGTVSDKAVLSDDEFNYLLQLYEDCPSDYPMFDSIEQYKEHLLSCYNVTVPVAEFTQKNSNEFIKTAKSFGIYNWQESYVDDSICDATNQYIIITFEDGTTKTTRFYYKYPENFEKVEAAFDDYFGVRAWCDLRLK